MLMQSFQSAADLGISEAQKEALMKTLVLLETGKLKHVPIPGETDGLRTFGFSHQFNMSDWGAPSPCGSICCIGGTAELIGGLEEYELFKASENNRGLDVLFFSASGMSANTSQTARALRSYLTTGDAKWAEAVSVAE
ncbi:TPA: hypothetical protein O5T86_001284 [Staphylococcus aureus]|nr:hypothetical protein [Staphylococcus aureus]HDA7217739.1 hypothetical protein [Staphylococcus aureus]HDA7235029.1 hypothetical protein [Staphylococcus aureus]HDA7236821.1 hypothetical protein [Staphylococcus aureus]HDA7239247.1 hypothetical protein [Staphylococcus aureus]